MFKKFILSSFLLIFGALAGVMALFYYREHLPWDIFAPVMQAYEAPVFVNVPIAETADDFARIVNAVSPSVVNISTIKLDSSSMPTRNDPLYDLFSDFFSPRGETEKRHSESDLGSGLVVSPDGYILTSNHVVSGAYKITVTLFDRRVFNGRLIGADPKTDLAVIKIDAEELSTIPWGDSDNISAGKFVLAIGNPFGLSHTITMGIISAVGRANVGIAEFEDFIQTDAAINPGNSGGPLVNRSGSLVGINTAIFTKSGGYQGIGFAVPSNMAKLVMDRLIKDGRVIRGWLGMQLQELTPELAAKFGHKPGQESAGGALVSDTMPGSPAREAGIISGDIVLEFDGRDVGGYADLKRMVALSTPGKGVSMKLLRQGSMVKKTLSVGELKAEAATESSPEEPFEGDVFSGLSVITLTGDISSQLNLEAEASGVVVAGMEPGSPASEAGIKRGDVIEEINMQPVKTVSEFRKLSGSITPAEEPVLVLVNRGGRRFFRTISR